MIEREELAELHRDAMNEPNRYARMFLLYLYWTVKLKKWHPKGQS